MDRKNQWLIDLCREDIWAKKLEDVPSMIHFAYMQLKTLAENGQVYGVLLQTKDCYESLYKIPVLMALIILENNPENKDKKDYAEIIRTALGSPMSMGQWDRLAWTIVKKNKVLELPESLIRILKNTRKLYENEVSPEYSDIVNWRNNSIAHGSLRFEDDPAYQTEIQNLLIHLKEYFDGDDANSIVGLYSNLYFIASGMKLTGPQQRLSGIKDVILFAEGRTYQSVHYLTGEYYRIIMFESYYSRNNLSKYSSFSDGQSEMKKSQYFSELYEKYVLRERSDFCLEAEIITREQEAILEYLHSTTEYIKPTGLIEKLQDQMTDLDHGLIFLAMERGLGKSAFANQMSGLFHKQPLIKGSFSRCYHVKNALLCGINDFYNAVNFNFRHSYDPSKDLWGGTDTLPSLSGNEDNPAKAMADYLNFYHRKYNCDSTILVIDGVDEITESTRRILDYIPQSNDLDDGVFVILLSRFEDEETVQGYSRKMIALAREASDAVIEIRRKDEININLLKTCIETWKKKGRINELFTTEELLKKADYRFLFLKPFFGMSQDASFDITNETSFIKSYLNYMMSFYGPAQRQQLRELLVTFALFPSITLKDYQHFLNCQDLTYEFIGLLNDILPLLTVYHKDGEDAYELADLAYTEYVLNEFKIDVRTVYEAFIHSYNQAKIHLPYFGYRGRRRSCTDEEWQEVNRHYIFFLEAFCRISGMAEKYASVMDAYFRDKSIWDLFSIIYRDEWTENGYGSFLKEELISSIFSGLLFCAQHENAIVCKVWEERINENLNEMPGLPWLNLKNKELNELYLFLLGNLDNEIPKWFWIFCAFRNEDSAGFLEKHNIFQDFAEYIMHHAFVENDWWLRRASEANNIDQELKNSWIETANDWGNFNNAYIHGMTVDEKPVNNARTKIRKKVQEMLQKHDPDIIMEKKLAISNAIDFLLDFSKEITPTQKNQVMIEADAAFRYCMSKSAGLNEVKSLCSAYYKRMCFERDRGKLADMMEYEKNFSIEIVPIIRLGYKGKKCINDVLCEWIKTFEAIADKEHLRTVYLLEVLILNSIKWLEKNGRNAEAKEQKLYYVYHWCTKAFLSREWTRPCGKESEIVDNPDQIVYCFDNALAVLWELYADGNRFEFKRLMETIEKSIPFVDQSIGRIRAFSETCEIERCRFMKLRKELNYHSDFDVYLDRIVNGHYQYIQKEMENISRYSDFNEFHFQIVLCMEYPWQMCQWNHGVECCERLIGLLKQTNTTDEIVIQFLEKEIQALNEYQEFFKYVIAHDKGPSQAKDFKYQHRPASFSFFFDYGEIDTIIGNFCFGFKESGDDQKNYTYNGVLPFGYECFGYDRLV